MKSNFLLRIAAVCMLAMLPLSILPQAANAFQQEERVEKEERQDRGAEKRAGQESRRESGVRDGQSRREGERPDSLSRTRRDSADADRGRARDGEVSEEDRAERRAGQGERENPRELRGRDRTPEQLRAELDRAREQEMNRHTGRMTRIEEIRQMAEADGNESAMTRVAALTEKENKLHEKKISKLDAMEARLAQRMGEGGEERDVTPRKSSENIGEQ